MSPLRLDGRGACILRLQTHLVDRSSAGAQEKEGSLLSTLGFALGQGDEKEGFAFKIRKILCSWGEEDEQLCHRASERTYQVSARILADEPPA